MDQNNIPPQAPAPAAPVYPLPTPQHKIGPIIGIVIIVVLLVLAALYFWSQKFSKSNNYDQTPVTQNQTEQTVPVRNDTAEPANSGAPTTPAEVEADSSLGLDALDSIDSKLDF